MGLKSCIEELRSEERGFNAVYMHATSREVDVYLRILSNISEAIELLEEAHHVSQAVGPGGGPTPSLEEILKDYDGEEERWWQKFEE